MEGEHDVVWAGRKAVRGFGAVTVAFWLSRAMFPHPIPPLAPAPDLDGLVAKVKSAPAWIQEEAGLGVPEEDLVASLRREVAITLAVRWLQIALGAASGVLIVRRRQVGRRLALGLCSVLLALLLVAQARLGLEGHLTTMWRVYAEHTPRMVVDGVATLLFYVGTLAYLTRPAVAARFTSR